jgi:hypothetical protein
MGPARPFAGSTNRLPTLAYRSPEVGLGTWKYRAATRPSPIASKRWSARPAREFLGRAFIATKVFPGHFRFDDVLKPADGSLKAIGD